MNRKNISAKEARAFHARFCPFADRLYRSALIVTGNPSRAEQLQVDIYLKAFVEYLHAGHLSKFESWLSEIASACFAEYELQRSAIQHEREVVSEAFQAALRKLIDCKEYKQSKSQKYVAIPN